MFGLSRRGTKAKPFRLRKAKGRIPESDHSLSPDWNKRR